MPDAVPARVLFAPFVYASSIHRGIPVGDCDRHRWFSGVEVRAYVVGRSNTGRYLRREWPINTITASGGNL